MTEYTDSMRSREESAIRRSINSAARRTKTRHQGKYLLSQNEAAILRKIVNLALKHWPKPIHPGVKHLATSSGLHERTVQYALRRFERERVLNVRGHIAGGRSMARDYEVDFLRLLTLIDPLPDVKPGDLIRVFRPVDNLCICHPLGHPLGHPLKGENFAPRIKGRRMPSDESPIQAEAHLSDAEIERANELLMIASADAQAEWNVIAWVESLPPLDPRDELFTAKELAGWKGWEQ